MRILCAVLLSATALAAQGLKVRVTDVTDPDAPSGLGGAQVSLRDAATDTFLAAVETDSSGVARFAGPLAGSLRVTAGRFGYDAPSGEAYRNIDCAETCGPVEIELQRGAVIVLTVLDDVGEPVPHVSARARCRAAGEEADRNYGGGTTDDRGLVRLAGVRPGDCRLEVSAIRPIAGGLALMGEPVDLVVHAGETASATVIMRPESVTEVTLRGQVHGVEIDPEGRQTLLLHSSGRRGAGRGSHRIPVRADGSFELARLPADEYVIRIVDAGGRRQDAFLGRHEIVANPTTLLLEPVEPWSFRGRLEFDGPAPDRPLVIVLRDVDSRVGAGFQTRPPEFEFSAVRPEFKAGDYRVEIQSEDWYIQGVVVGGLEYSPDAVPISRSAATELVVRMSARFASLRGRVRAGAATTPGAHFRVGLERLGDGRTGRRSVQADQVGRFAFERLAPGDYRITVWKDLSESEAVEDAAWERSGALLRQFPVEAGAEIEIDLTAAPKELARP